MFCNSKNNSNDDFAPRFKKYETIVEENENDLSPRHPKGYCGRRKDEVNQFFLNKNVKIPYFFRRNKKVSSKLECFVHNLNRFADFKLYSKYNPYGKT